MNTTPAPPPRRVRTAATVVALLVAVTTLGACGGGSSSASTTSTSTTSTTTTDPDAPPAGAVAKGLNSLQVGQCFLPVTGNDAAEDRAVWVVDCSDPHLYELYERLKYSGPGAASSGFPGATAVQNWSEQECFDKFESYVGVPWTRSDLEIQTWWPSIQSWGKPDRTVLCAVTPADGGLTTGSKAGTSAGSNNGDGTDTDSGDDTGAGSDGTDDSTDDSTEDSGASGN